MGRIWVVPCVFEEAVPSAVSSDEHLSMPIIDHHLCMHVQTFNTCVDEGEYVRTGLSLARNKCRAQATGARRSSRFAMPFLSVPVPNQLTHCFARSDVVPVNPDTVDQWEHPPYSGFFDG